MDAADAASGCAGVAEQDPSSMGGDGSELVCGRASRQGRQELARLEAGTAACLAAWQCRATLPQAGVWCSCGSAGEEL